jgi:peptidoglycan hydrolase-like protein with peptidoglycan-binding domain
VKALQHILYALGFEAELKWARYGADGDYGRGTASAIAKFARRNGIDSGGDRVTPPIAEAMLDRHHLLSPLRKLRGDVEAGRVADRYYRNSGDAAAVAALQTLLNALGYGEQMAWATFGADGHYGSGTARAVRSFAASEGSSIDGNRLDAGMARRVVDRVSAHFGDAWSSVPDREEGGEETTAGGLAIEERVERGKTRVYVSDGTENRRFTRVKLGLYTIGDHDPRTFVEENRESLAEDGLTDSAINVMVSVSDNEGCLDAINTWDNAFLSFGMFQWTAGTGSSKGELPALLQRLKQGDPESFERFFSGFGLDVVNAGSRYGYFSLNGARLDSEESKNVLRGPEWAFRFCVSGADPVVQRMEVLHALARLDTFYTAQGSAVQGHLISELVTSEYGVALLLDNHVNRPGYIQGCLEQALDESDLGRPNTWRTAEERILIQNYLRIRSSYGRWPMTDADKRAEVTRGYLTRGVISDRRGSFKQR